MPVLTRLVPTPLTVVIRAGAVGDLVGILADQRITSSGRLAMVVSGGSGTRLRAGLEPHLPNADWYQVEGGSLTAAVDLSDRMRAGNYDAAVGIGGGRVLDATKYAAARVGLPMVAVATNLAHDGICSPVATLDNDKGRGSYGVPVPIAMVIDLDLIRQAPQRFVRAGIGEMLSNLCAVADWELSQRETGEQVDGLAAALARNPAEAMLYRTDGLESDAFVTSLAEGLVLSGVAMSVSGNTRPASGACHEISHAMDLLFPGKGGEHGEQVGLGAAFATHLRGDAEFTRTLVGCLDRHQVPYLPEHLGFDLDDFVRTVRYAPETRPGRYTILEHLDLSEDALYDAVKDYVDTYGG
jgi:glycerol-1-phosphate dehydrogenase [NAD(P)+]